MTVASMLAGCAHILPTTVQSIPGFRVESVYFPARDVGGDFFQILPVGEGDILLVI
jgi:phosphoserine phosphatase RsbU/P